MLASAVGAALPLIAIYVFGFRQIIAAKDARIEVLKEQIERLKEDVAPSVLLEKKTLVAEIEVRAQERKRIDAEAQKEVDNITAILEELHNRVTVELHPLIVKAGDVARAQISANTQLGILAGRISLTKTLYWLHGLIEDRSDPVIKSLNVFLMGEIKWLDDLRLKIRGENHILTLEDIPFSPESMNELREQARAERRAFCPPGK
jgi:hypothetical protein